MIYSPRVRVSCSSRFPNGLKVRRRHQHCIIGSVEYIVMEFVEEVPSENLVSKSFVPCSTISHGGLYFILENRSCCTWAYKWRYSRGHPFSKDGAGTLHNIMTKLNQWLNKRVLFDDMNKFAFNLSDCRFS